MKYIVEVINPWMLHCPSILLIFKAYMCYTGCKTYLTPTLDTIFTMNGKLARPKQDNIFSKHGDSIKPALGNKLPKMEKMPDMGIT